MSLDTPAPESRGSAGTGTGSATTGQSTLRERPVRSLPPWIDSYEASYGPAGEDQFHLLQAPGRSVPPQHNTTPSEPKRRVSKDGFVDYIHDAHLEHGGPHARIKLPAFLLRGHGSQHGRKWDHLRTAEPVVVGGYSTAGMTTPAPAWREFLHSSMYGRMPNEESEVVDFETLAKLQPNFDRPVDVPLNPLDPQKSRRRRTLALYKRVWQMMLRHTLVPLATRLTVMLTSIIAIAIAARIYQAESARDSAERTQAVVAVAIDCIAIPYISYMLWDEYTGKPLGLRPAAQKFALILLDLFFIIFKSASTALAFESLGYHNTTEGLVRSLSKALASFMLVGLIAWTMTFMLNVFRTVERLGGGEDESGGRR